MPSGAKMLPTDAKIGAFLNSLDNENRRVESLQLIELMQRLSGNPPVMWGASIIGFGQYSYTYGSGHSGASMRVGFSPRKGAMTVYLAPGFDNKSEILNRLGQHTLGKSCLYIKDLSKVDFGALEDIIAMSLKEMAENYP
jgi:Domain of unknown function (DU1801)